MIDVKAIAAATAVAGALGVAALGIGSGVTGPLGLLHLGNC
ncbi:hypothetical protein [Mycolicibacterium hodleri]|nr:hypothetical protein [Mycolicibacterium hodleri]